MLKDAQWAWWDDGEIHALAFDNVQADYTIAFPDCLHFVSTEPIYCLPVHRFEVYADEPRLYSLVLCKKKRGWKLFQEDRPL